MALSAAAVMCLIGCQRAPTFVQEPGLVSNPNPSVPLAAIVSAETDRPTVLDVRISDGTRDWSIPTPAALVVTHRVPVLGFRPGRRHVVRVTARDGAGNASATIPLEFDAAALPDDFPALQVLVNNPGRMEPGVTLFALMRWPAGREPDLGFGLAIAVDDEGEVVWYRRSEQLFEDPHRLANGNLIGLVGHNRIEEVDMLGNVVMRWHASRHPNPKAEVPEGSIPVAVETFHHEVQELPSGNLLVLATELRQIPDYPAEVGTERSATGPANVIGDVVVEFARDGTIVGEWKLMDLLDVRRLSYSSLEGVWDRWAYVDVDGGTRDWSHANSVVYHAESDSFLVSVRHQDAVISFSRSSGELNWILGAHQGWEAPWAPHLLEPDGDLQWQYHQHAAEMTPAGSLMLFDNGNFRAFPPDPKTPAAESYSRAVEYRIDSERRTVRQVWAYGGPGQEIFFAPFLGEADHLPGTGNVLITDGGRVRDPQGRASGQVGGGHHWARILEVTRSPRPEKVFEIIIDAEPQQGEIGWAVYRSERLPGLYVVR